MSTYLGYPVLDILPWREPGPRRVTQARAALGAPTSDAGAQALLDLAGTATTPNGPSGTFPLAWTCETRAQYAALRAFLDPLRGAQGLFWCPSLQHDFVSLGAGAAVNTLVVRSWGWAASVFPFPAWRTLYCARRLADGSASVLPVTVTAAATGVSADVTTYGAGVETLTATDPVDAHSLWGTFAGATTAGGLLLCQAQVACLADDALAIEWLRGTACRVTAAARWRPEEHP